MSSVSTLLLKQTNKRIEWVDYSKAIGIILVIFAHILNQCATFQYLSELIYSFHMPLFFILSGYVLSSRTFSLGTGEIFSKYIKALLYPYWFYTLGNIIISVLAKQDFSYVTVSRYLFDFLFFRGWNATWFLSALFMAMVTAVFMLKRQKDGKIFFVGSIVCMYVCINFIPWRPCILKSVLLGAVSLPFVLFGYMLKNIPFLKWNTWCFVLFAFIWFILATLNGKVDMVNFRFGISPFLWFLNSLLGSMVLFKLSSYIVSSGLAWIGRNTLTVMCIHQCILYIFLFIIRKFIVNPYFVTFVITFITFTVTFLLTPGVSYLYNSLIGRKNTVCK